MNASRDRNLPKPPKRERAWFALVFARSRLPPSLLFAKPNMCSHARFSWINMRQKRYLAIYASLGAAFLSSHGPAQASAFVAGIRMGPDVRVDRVLDAFEETIERLTAICDRENASARGQGVDHCPFSTCFVESVSDGRTPPPELKFEITYSGNLDSSVTGVDSRNFQGTSVAPSQQVSGGIVSTTTSSSRQGLVARIALTVWLGKKPSSLKCVNPMSESMREAVVKTVLDIASGSAEFQE